MDSRNHAVVIGASLAGLASACVLAKYFTRVTLVERDTLSHAREFRKGVPQARHAHGLTTRGAAMLESLFPGLRLELEQAGAAVIDQGESISTWGSAGRIPFNPVGLTLQMCTRPLLEASIRRRVMALHGVKCLEGHEVVQLLMTGREASGVMVRRCTPDGTALPTPLAAEWVVDASGRFSNMAHWLQQLGLEPPAAEVVDAGVVYASCTFKTASQPWGALYQLNRVPDQPRGVYAVYTERGEWLVTLYGAMGDKPGVDERAFRDFAATLGNPDLDTLLDKAVCLSSVTRYGRTENQRRAYATMSDWPQRLVVVGDAACAFNPVYGQGMTLAVKQALMLGELFSGARAGPGTARRFQRAQQQVTAWPWRLAVSDDVLWQARLNQRQGPLSARAFNAYKALLYRAVMHDPVLYRLFLQVFHQVRHPLCMFSARPLARAAQQWFRSRWSVKPVD